MNLKDSLAMFTCESFLTSQHYFHHVQIELIILPTKAVRIDYKVTI